MSDPVVVIVSGRRFEVDNDVLSRFPDSTLGQVAATGQKEVTYQRPTSVFECVLTYHQTGHLHIPLSECPGLVQNELDFWGFNIDDIDPCCRRKVKKFQREQNDILNFEKSFSDNTSRNIGCCLPSESRIAKGLHCLWVILDEPLSSILAKVYFLFSTLMILLSILILFLDTMDEFKEEMSMDDWKNYLGSSYDDYEDQIHLLSGDHDLLRKGNLTFNEIVGNFTLPDYVFVENKVFANIQIFCTMFFVLELLLRLVCCPNIIQFLKTFLNIIDVLAVIVSLTELLAEYVSPGHRYTDNYVDALGALQVLRVLRLLRLTKNITGARVLAFAVSSSYKELCFMALLIAINTILFGTLAHSVDKTKMKDLPLASWWALITMTTVGYGDVVPSNHAGKFIGVLCACMGVMVLALTMPLFVDNFLTFYAYGQEICKKKSSEKTVNVVKVSPVRKTDEVIE